MCGGVDRSIFVCAYCFRRSRRGHDDKTCSLVSPLDIHHLRATGRVWLGLVSGLFVGLYLRALLYKSPHTHKRNPYARLVGATTPALPCLRPASEPSQLNPSSSSPFSYLPTASLAAGSPPDDSRADAAVVQFASQREQ